VESREQGCRRHVPTLKPDGDELIRNIVYFASEYGRYGYGRITAPLNGSGIEVGKDRVQLPTKLRFAAYLAA
jgi:hypothetical protein